MKNQPTFRFVNYSPPQKTVEDYSDVEKELFKTEFQSTAENYHRGSKFVAVGFFSLIVLFFIFWVLGANGIISQKFTGFIVVCFVVLLITFIFTILILAIKHDPICPACDNAVDRVLKTFCPECGNGQILSGGFFKSPHCNSCGKDLRRGKGRHYTIRFCTHCGISLDDKGI
jgi:predicted RNA-binding Zn-ribbon protein involved in translation (DUF1610 family)